MYLRYIGLGIGHQAGTAAISGVNDSDNCEGVNLSEGEVDEEFDNDGGGAEGTEVNLHLFQSEDSASESEVEVDAGDDSKCDDLASDNDEQDWISDSDEDSEYGAL